MVRWGVFGTAQITKVCVIPAILKSKNGVLQAIASRNLAKTQALVEKHQQGVVHESYAALLEDPKIDAVHIPLPNQLHKGWTIKALRAEKHVLVEKPFAMNAGEAKAMAAAALRHGRLLMEAFMYRFHPRSERIKQLVEEDALGKISLIRSAFTFPVTCDGSNERLFLLEMGGGSLWDVGCYGVILARWLLGEEPGADEYQLMAEHFASAVQGHAQLAISPGDNVNQMRVPDALARAARLGEVVQLGDGAWSS